jgi:hypothetical protein
MRKVIVPSFLAFAILSIASCGPSELEKMKAENDSLRKELETRHSMVTIMNEVKVLLDTIDNNRQVLRMDLHEGTTADNVATRLKDINDYVKKTTDKLETLESDLKSSKNENSAYLMMVHALKEELLIRKDEVHALEKTVNKFKSENKGLIQTVKIQQDQLSDLQNQINTKQQELALIQAKVDEMVQNFKVSEADSYYARGQSVEEAARRTRLAPHKKKETYREALELYKKSLSLGKTEAQAKITELEKKVN